MEDNKYNKVIIYYKTKKECLNNRKKGDRICYSAKQKSYYIIRPRIENVLTKFDYILLAILILILLFELKIFDCGLCVYNPTCNIFGLN